MSVSSVDKVLNLIWKITQNYCFFRSKIIQHWWFNRWWINFIQHPQSTVKSLKIVNSCLSVGLRSCFVVSIQTQAKTQWCMQASMHACMHACMHARTHAHAHQFNHIQWYMHRQLHKYLSCKHKFYQDGVMTCNQWQCPAILVLLLLLVLVDLVMQFAQDSLHSSSSSFIK